MTRSGGDRKNKEKNEGSMCMSPVCVAPQHLTFLGSVPGRWLWGSGQREEEKVDYPYIRPSYAPGHVEIFFL